jgi:hypothetical protein
MGVLGFWPPNAKITKRMRIVVIFLMVFLGLAQAGSAQNEKADEVEANPARPTVSTPATITPPGYLQFETGMLAARHSPEFSSQQGLNEVVKLSFSPRLELFADTGPFVHSRVLDRGTNGTAEVFLGLQGVVHRGEGANPTVAVSYGRRIYGGDTPDLDLGSPRNSLLLLASADVKGFHYDLNSMFNEVIEGATHRGQFGQSLSVSHPLAGKLGISVEVWHFTQPFLRGNAVGNLWAWSYTARHKLVFDGGFNRGLTSTSTRWEYFVGFTYLLPHKFWR